MGVEAKYAQDAARLCEIASDNLLQVRNPPRAPVFYVAFCKQFHRDQNSDRRDKVFCLQLSVDRFDDSRIILVRRVVV